MMSNCHRRMYKYLMRLIIGIYYLIKIFFHKLTFPLIDKSINANGFHIYIVLLILIKLV